jgi:hypothetical protein
MKPKSASASKCPTSQADPEVRAAQQVRAARNQAPTGVQPVEPEDAYLTGVSRSLQRRLLGLNVEGTRPQAKPVPEASVAGLHSTGSYSKTQGVKPSDSPKMNTTGKKK